MEGKGKLKTSKLLKFHPLGGGQDKPKPQNSITEGRLCADPACVKKMLSRPNSTQHFLYYTDCPWAPWLCFLFPEIQFSEVCEGLPRCLAVGEVLCVEEVRGRHG